jgi:nitrate/TMAO reductase-like tetraheme cytochrome c subunit
MKRLFVLLVLMLLTPFLAGSAAASICIDCHSGITPEIVEDFQSGAMAGDVDCSDCHGFAHSSLIPLIK